LKNAGSQLHAPWLENSLDMENHMAVDVEKFVLHLRKNSLPPFGRGLCATHVRKALEAGGAHTTGHPVYAKAYDKILRLNGFRVLAKVSEDFRQIEKGDIAVMQPPVGKSAGHIQAWDGKNWISDFLQTAFWPGPDYRKDEPDYAIYRCL
jgi:hypothetical protein